MPLHLLGKKSWNVYNAENIARVRRDEAEARAQEEERERRMQEIDAERRLAILRGVTPPPLPAEDDSVEPQSGQKKRERHDVGRDDYRKRRRLRGEDDTDRDIRLAKEDHEKGRKAKEGLSKESGTNRKATSDAPLIDRTGHIDLFPQEKGSLSRKEQARNAKTEKEAEKKKRELEDQYSMRFSDAAGHKQGMEQPWYASNGKQDLGQSTGDEIAKDVWGNEDPRRNERAKTRMQSNDPMAFMQRAQTQLKVAERDRSKFEEERRRELKDLEKHDRRQKRMEKRKAQEDELEGFSLDARPEKEHRSRHRHSHHRHRSRDREHREQRHHRSSKRSRSRSPGYERHNH
ncbi:MAG: hypothetical protein M1821_008777 [Bathelium mastoideum]|nr:MAG: hypothetical protein M1821_008777 [Bathelium mastoideum]